MSDEFKLEKIEDILMRRDGMSLEEAQDMIKDAQTRILFNGEDPEEILHEEFGLEPDYLFQLVGWI